MIMTYFARHNRGLDIDDATRRTLWEERRIAIHFPHDKRGERDEDSSSLDPNDYDGGARRTMEVLVELATNGGYVCAEHSGHDEVQLGKVAPGSRLEPLYGKWGKVYGFEGRTAILKSLRLTHPKIVSPSAYALILVGRPRQGTLNRWPSAGTVIADSVEGRAVASSLASLSATQQEVLCSEFLRTPQAAALGLPILASLLLPVGRTLKDVDIFGLATDGKVIFAQVTYSDRQGSSWKLERLLKYGESSGSHLLLFCNTEEVEHQQGVIIVPLRRVFESYIATDVGKRWLMQFFPKAV